MTPLKPFQWCHWHCWNFRPDPYSCFQSVNDTAEIWQKKFCCGWNQYSAVSLTPLKWFLRCQWHHWNSFSGVNDTAETAMRIRSKVSVVSMTRRKWFQQCHWHRWNSNNVDYLGEHKACESGAQGVLFDEKTEHQKSRDSVPLSIKLYMLFCWKSLTET
jgi:hypothetical protein